MNDPYWLMKKYNWIFIAGNPMHIYNKVTKQESRGVSVGYILDSLFIEDMVSLAMYLGKGK